MVAHTQEDTYDQQWRWVHFTTESGLPSNIIFNIIETTNGTPWIATIDGLAWYDGFQWILCDSSKGIPQTRANKIIPDLKGGVLTIINGVLYQGNERGFVQLSKRRTIQHVAPLSEKEIFVLTHDSLFLFDGKTFRYIPTPTKDSLNLFYSGIYRTRSGNIWLNMQRFIYRWENNEWIKYLQTHHQVNSVVDNTSGAGILALHHSLGLGFWEWEPNAPPVLNKSEDSNLLQSIDIAPNGDAIAVTEFTQIRLRRNMKWFLLSLFPVHSPHVNAVRFRDNGDLWVCTENGIYLYRKSLDRWKNIKHPTSTSHNLINDILIGSDSSLWLASDAGVENVSRTGERKFFTHANSQELRRVTAIMEDFDKGIWISSGIYFDGAYRWDGKTWTYFAITKDTSKIFVHDIIKGNQGRLWFMGLGKKFAYLGQPGAYQYENGQFKRWGEQEGLISGRVYSLVEESDSTYWFGTLSGISRWSNGVWRHWGVLPPTKTFPRGYTLAKDRNGNIWFGSGGEAGLVRIDKNEGVHFTTSSTGLVSDNVVAISYDSTGKLWIGTKAGLACNYDDTYFIMDDKTGLSSLNISCILRDGENVYIGTIGGGYFILNLKEETYPPSKIFLDDPVIESDQVFLRWKALSYWGQIPPEDIYTRYRLDNGSWTKWRKAKEIHMKELTSGAHTFEVQAKGLFGNYNPKGATMSFTIPRPFYQSLLFGIPIISLTTTIIILLILLFIRKRNAAIALRKSEIRFRRLTEAAFEGIFIHDEEIILDANESFTRMFGYQRNEIIGRSIFEFISPESHDIIKQHISSGLERQFEITGTKKDGTPISLEIIGKQIPFENSMVRVEAIRDITDRKIAGEKILAYQEELRSLSAKASLAEERERRKMASYVHDQIIQSLAICKLELSTIQESFPTKKVSKPMMTIETLLDQLINDSRSLIFSLSPPVLHQLGFEPAITWLVDNFRRQYNLKIFYTYDQHPIHLSEDTKIVLFDAVREIFINTVKHARATTLSIDLRNEGACLVIRINDDGIGFDPDAKKNVHIRQTGFGLFNIRERLSDLGCDIEIESAPGKGSAFILIAPLFNSNHSKKEEIL